MNVHSFLYHLLPDDTLTELLLIVLIYLSLN